ncbi:MAG: diguanylate cyclase [Nostocales cyanobacterium]|nr:MAG: diguanylate cyclase [Nostocales cyanobacterium]TAF19172.1 MAG: diguanylate cyclase [Nostocales cyanobacterium]
MRNEIDKNKAIVLVVDDDLIIQMQLRQAMEIEGYEVIVANNGQEAIDIYLQIQPDIVLLDAIMPVMDGFTCCAQIQTIDTEKFADDLNLKTPILMITGLEDQESVDKAFFMGASDYITKPIHWAVLRKRVHRLLQINWAMRELKSKVEQEKIIAKISNKIRESLNLETILKTAVQEVRQLLQTDRVIVYGLQAEKGNSVLVESVSNEWHFLDGKQFKLCSFLDQCSGIFKPGSIQIINDIKLEGTAKCQIYSREKSQVKASLSVPIIQDENLWGLLIADQFLSPRKWQQTEITLLQKIANQLVIGIRQAQIHEQLELANKELIRLANIDSLTQIANRRCFDQVLEKEWQRMKREKLPFSLILCDIDYFKNYNDTYGHPGGDQCLINVAKILNNSVKRTPDLVARYGGEEFAIILPNTENHGAVYIAETIQNQLLITAIPHNSSLVSECVTLTMGIATLVPSTHNNPQDIICAADQALYEAKQNGRNRYCVAKNLFT